MATVVRTQVFRERRVGERRASARAAPALRGAEGMRVSWGGIFGGVLVALGVLLLLAALGAAIGASAARPGGAEPGALGAGIWAGASLLIALFVGGMVATRIGAIFDPTTGVFEGVLVWVVSVLLVAYLAASGVGVLVGGASEILGNAGQAVGDMVERANGALQRNAAELAPRAGTAAWISFGALVVSLLASVLGAMAGRRRY